MWKKLASKVVFEHPRMTLIEDTVELPNGVQVPYLKFAKKNDSATVLCVSGDKILLQKEYSYPTGEVLYQFPGGKTEQGETPLQAASRELAEEAGLKPGEMAELGWYYVDNRRTSAKMYVFLATGCEEVIAKGGDIEEEITSHWTPLDAIEGMIRSGEIVNYSVLAAWSMYVSSLSNSKNIMRTYEG